MLGMQEIHFCQKSNLLFAPLRAYFLAKPQYTVVGSLHPMVK